MSGLQMRRVGVRVSRPIVVALMNEAVPHPGWGCGDTPYLWRVDRPHQDLDKFTEFTLYPEGAEWEGLGSPLLDVWLRIDGVDQVVCVRAIPTDPFDLWGDA